MAEINLKQKMVKKKGSISLLGAVFIGIGSMVGAGIFALFGEAGAIAGAAVWVSFLIRGHHRPAARLFVCQARDPLPFCGWDDRLDRPRLR